FWQMGDTGPCGPCSEIYYDMGQAASETPDKDLPFGEDDARYVEIWNLVFMQFDRSADGVLTPLPKPCVDTGAGLERIAAVLQDKLSNFDTDLFKPLTDSAALATLSGTSVSLTDAEVDASYRIIADHSRAATFLISDGVIPSNEGRGYVLRKILRRAIRHGRRLGTTKPFLSQMIYAVRDEMWIAYPELALTTERVVRVVLAEEERFARTISTGVIKLEEAFEEVRTEYLNALDIKSESDQGNTEGWTEDQIEQANELAVHPPTLGGSEAFHLYETYGLPKDLIQEACRDTRDPKILFDDAGFEKARAEEQARARASWKGGSKATASPVYRELPKTIFEGYRQLESTHCEVLALVKDGLGAQEVKAGESAEVVLDHTSFYADSGGQVGDHGWLYSEDGNVIVAEVLGCTKPVQGIFAHKIVAKQSIALGDKVNTVVDPAFRAATVRNHTATHLLHAALRETLGTHVKQAGSLNDPQHLRFDFSHFAAVADEELQDIEDLINKNVLANTQVVTLEDVPIDVAVNEYHAMALFGEKYGDKVRVVKIGDFSTELCGGTHAAATGEIGLVKLLAENSVSSGVRRIEAVTGTGALEEFRRDFAVTKVAEQVAGKADTQTPADALRNKLTAQEEELKRLRRELDEARMKSAAGRVSNAAAEAVEVSGVKVLAQRVDALDRGQVRTLVDNLRGKLGSGVVVLGGVQEDGKVALIVGVTKDLTSRVQAGKIVAQLAQMVGGSGGGRPDMAEAGGKDASQLDAALRSAPQVVQTLLG
ncbi:MAG: alanine--tRNA ligase, partial [Acidobacteriaceae bacterium]